MENALAAHVTAKDGDLGDTLDRAQYVIDDRMEAGALIDPAAGPVE